MQIEVDPHYEPRAGKQDQFHKDRIAFWARLISAGTGAGKTYAGFYEAWHWTANYAGSVGLLLEPTYGMITRILIPTFFDFFGSSIENCPAVKEYNKSENHITWINGSTWWMLSLEDPEKVEGQNVDWAWLDEFRLVGGSGNVAKRKQETAWNTIIRRLRGSKYGREHNTPTGLWVTTTPDAPGSILHQKFEDPFKKLPSSMAYRWSIDDNPVLSAEYRAEVKRAHVEGTGLYDRFVLGRFAAVAAGSYAFDPATHILKQLQPRDCYVDVAYGVDWGWTNPSCILAVLFDGDDRAYIVEEFYKPRCPIEEIVQAAIDMKNRWGDGRFYCDRAEPRNIEALCNADLDAVADESKREDGIHEVGGRFQVQDDKKPRIYVTEECVNWIDEVQSYVVEEKQHDHAQDAFRYVVANRLSGGGNVEVGYGYRNKR